MTLTATLHWLTPEWLTEQHVAWPTAWYLEEFRRVGLLNDDRCE